MCSNVDPLKLKEIAHTVEYPSTLADEENIYKYAPYVSWCPSCDRSSRIRSQSECLGPCRKKSKEMKSACVNRYLNDQGYENMELEYSRTDDWFNTKHQRANDSCKLKPTMNGTNEHQYYDCCSRVRSNLCELPTSYIRNTNCCQPNYTLKMSDRDKDYVDCLENRVKSYEKTIRYVEYTENSSVLQLEYEKSAKKEYDDRLQKSSDKLEGIQSHYNGIVKYSGFRGNIDVLQIDPRKMEDYNLANREASPKARENQSSEVPNVNEQDKYCQTECCYSKGYFKSNNSYRCRVEYDTETYFDKDHHGREESLSCLYAREMHNLREQLKELRNSAYKNSTSAEMVAKSLDAKDKEIEEKQNVSKLVKSSPRPVRRTRSKLIRVKTKGSKIIHTVKVRRPNTRPSCSRTLSVEKEEIQSDYSDAEESIKETEEDTYVSDVSHADTSSIEPSTSTEAGSGDFALLPIRESLFPNIPPYILFNSFDAEEPRQIPVGKKFLKWKLSTITPVIVRKVLTNSGFIMVRNSNQWLGTWGKHIKSPMFKTLKISQKLNHFPGTFQLGRKDRLWRNFQRMIDAYGQKEFGFLPHTYVLPHELKLLKYNWENKNTGGDWWIIKPPASARGVGIRVINKWSQLPKKTSLVVQKYIADPYLINGSKFDLRLYVLVTSFHPLRIYLYSEGLVRFASVKYSSHAKDIKEKYMHLTNYSINKLSSAYTANEDANSAQGHKWTITKLLEHFNREGVDTKSLWKSFEMLVVKTMIACEPPITELCSQNMNTRYNCYELFGIDVLLDSKLKPWLLEVNISPSLHSSSPLDQHVKGPMVQSLFNMTQFHFPTKLATLVKPKLKCHEPRLYTMHLTPKEVSKHNKFTVLERRQDYLETILENLTGDDIRHLIQAEDELTVKDDFKRIFPTASSYKLLEFMEPSYYNRLFDAWETKYENNREAGIERLQGLCNDRVHLKGATLAGIQKRCPAMIPGEKVAGPKEKTPPKDVPQLQEMFTESTVPPEESVIPDPK